MSQVKGYTATLIFDGKSITIDRTKGLGRITVGKGTKRIPISSITSVQWKPAGFVMNGYIEFSLAGGNESQSKYGSATSNAVNNENAVIFTRKQMKDFEAIKSEIEKAIYG